MANQNGEKKTITANDMAADSFRLGLETALGQTGFNSKDDLTNRNHYEVFGWPRGDLDGWDEDNWLALYLRNAYAQVVNDKPAFITWRDDPEVVPRNGDSDSEFTELVDQLARNTRMWSYCERADRAAGIGQHGLLLVDTAQRRDRDDWETDAREESLNSLDGITGFRPILETQIEDINFGSFDDERWGEPIEYTLDLSEDVDEETQDDPLSNLTVHWSRVIDVPATRLLDDDTFARPRMEPVLNNLLDIEKTMGAAAEAAYRAADYGLHINADPSEVDLSQGADELAEELQRYEQDLQRYIRTQGMEVNRLGGDIQDPSGIIENNLDAISAETGIPKNELRGSVQGEMAAAEQAKQSLFGMAQERREQYANPYIVRELIDRLIELGVLPMPEGGYEINWPDLHELSESDRADIQQKRSSVIANVPGLVGQTAIDYLKDGAEALDDGQDMALPAMDEQSPDIQAQFEATTGVSANQEPSLDESIDLKESVVSAAQAALEADDGGLIPDRCGTGRGTQRANQIVDGDVTVRDLLTRDNGTPIPAYVNSHSEDFSGGAEDAPVSEWTEEMWSDCGNVGLARWGAQNQEDVRWWVKQANDLARQRDEEPPYPDITGNDSQYSEGDEVNTPEGPGVVVEVRTEDFEGPDGSEVSASEDSPTYVVGVEDGAATYKASDLSTGTIETDVENPEGELAEMQSNWRANQESTFRMPESWRESETPARLILLKAWAGLGGRFTSCVREMRGELTGSPDRFCAAMKDRVLQWEGWRQGG